MDSNGSSASHSLPCELCRQCRSKIPYKKFADCNHRLICLQCAEKLIKQCLSQNKKPTCPVESCSAKFNMGEQSPFEYISQSVVEQWQEKRDQLKNQTIKKLKPCLYQPCSGYINISNYPYKCSGCLKIYCQRCLKEHSQEQSCQPNIIKVKTGQEGKKCKCGSTVYKKGTNNVKCLKCNYQFCYTCLEEWSQTHRNCSEIQQQSQQQQPCWLFSWFRKHICVCTTNQPIAQDFK